MISLAEKIEHKVAQRFHDVVSAEACIEVDRGTLDWRMNLIKRLLLSPLGSNE